LPIKGFTGLPTKTAILKIVINQGLAIAIGLIAHSGGAGWGCAVHQGFCA
jgi:hypothetical protein